MPDQKVDAYMPLWIGEYLADTMGFKALQHGAYLLLLMAYWRSRAPLPDDDDELAGIARVTAAEWKALRPKLERKFQVADGVWKPLRPQIVIPPDSREYLKHREVVFAAHGELCVYCGETSSLTIDHVFPKSLGGSHDPSNLVPACRSCNSSKGAKTLEAWRSAQ